MISNVLGMRRQIVLLWLATLFQSVASADDLYSSAASESSCAWKIVGGGYLAQRDVNLHYQKKLDARNRVVDIGDPSSESDFRALPILTVEYSLSATDAVSFEYVSATVSTVAIAHRTQNLLFIPVRMACSYIGCRGVEGSSTRTSIGWSPRRS